MPLRTRWISPSLALAVALALILPAGGAPAARDAVDPDASYAERHLAAARAHLSAGGLDEARAEFVRVLEREPDNLAAVAGLVEVAGLRGDADEEMYYLNRYAVRAVEMSGSLTSEQQRTLRAFQQRLKESDPLYGQVESCRKAHMRRLLQLGAAHLSKGRFHAARSIFEEVVHLDPDSEEAQEAFHRIETEGGDELATERAFGTENMFEGLSQDWIRKQDALHAEWDKAWKKEIEGYTVITDAGYEVLEYTAAALSQLDRFYRIFYDHKVKGGGTPQIQVRIHKDRDEYMKIGNPSVEWAGGHYDGSAVVTYDPRGGQEGDGRAAQEPSRTLRGLIQTIAHEVSHHYVNIAKGSGIPAWLNEGFASFFEGTQLLSNGRVEWNLVAAHRLIPLVEQLDSPSPPKLADIIATKVDDYRIFYPYGWGLVYFFWNYEDDEGRYIYRRYLQEFRSLYVGGVDHLERFQKSMIERPAIPGIATLEEFEAAFREFIHEAYREYLGKAEIGREYAAKAAAYRDKGDLEKALLFYDKALKKIEGDPDLLFEKARVLEKMEDIDRAVGAYWAFLTNAEFRGIGDDPRLAEARLRIEALDPLAGRFKEVRAQFESDILSVAKGYRERGRYLRALETARELAVADNPSIAARDFYLDVEEESGKTLEQWRVAYNERDLRDWWGEEIKTHNFRAEGDRLVGTVSDADVPGAAPAPLTGGTGSMPGRTIPYKLFFIGKDVRGDFSLEAEMRAPAGCDLYGLCFGVKTKDTFNAALLKSGDDSLDLSRFDDAWFIRRHIPTYVSHADWNRLRLDVRANILKVFLNGSLVEELVYDSAAELRGEMGILVGRGSADFRNLRYLERNWRLPFRRVKRDLSPSYAAEARIERAPPGRVSYRGERPPELSILKWFEREPVTLDDLIGKVVVLVFWTTYQEEAVPLLPYLFTLQKTCAGLDVEVIVVSNDKLEDFMQFAENVVLPVGVAIDHKDRTVKAYAIPEVGLPHIKLLDLNGAVAWEGNPDWSEANGAYLDEPLKELVAARRLAEIAELRKEFPRARGAFDNGRYGEALKLFDRFQDMDRAHPDVAFAQQQAAAIHAAVRDLMSLAEERAAAGNLLSAAELLKGIQRELDGFPEAAVAAAGIAEIEKHKLYTDAVWIEHRINSALEAGGRGEDERCRDFLGRIQDRLERMTDGDMAGMRGAEYRFILRWLSSESGSAADLAGELDRLRRLRMRVETAEELAAGARLQEARRLCAEILTSAQGTPFEERVLELLDRL